MMDGLALMSRIHGAGATILVLDRKALDLTTPMGRGLLGLLSAVFEEERERIRKRALQGIANARRLHKRFGSRPRLRMPSESASARARATARSHEPTIARIVKHKEDHA
jgi:DNA invertase Pin-like site-specific DNA recombinase